MGYRIYRASGIYDSFQAVTKNSKIKQNSYATSDCEDRTLDVYYFHDK